MSYAVRNGRLCTKDCLCLYVCPVGATDTETGQIDKNKCISGCRLCVDICPSGAISLVPDRYPKEQKKDKEVVDILFNLADNKIKQEILAKSLMENTEDKNMKLLLEAIMKSNRIMAEDVVREAGYMLPQSENSIKVLQQENDISTQKTAKMLTEFLSKETKGKN